MMIFGKNQRSKSHVPNNDYSRLRGNRNNKNEPCDCQFLRDPQRQLYLPVIWHNGK